MNSFTLMAVGQLARNPEHVAKGNMTYTRFCLVGNDYAGKDEEGSAREIVTSLWFVAFGALGEAVARHARKGDQLFVEARVRGSNWTDKQGEKQYDHSFLVQGFRFGAPGRTKREERDARREDGHGPQRADERANGRDRSTNNGAYLSLGEGAGVVSHVGMTSEADSPTGTTSAATATGGAVEGPDDPVDGSEDEGTNNEEASIPGKDLVPVPSDSDSAAVGSELGDHGDDGMTGVVSADSGASPVARRATKDGTRRAASAGRGAAAVATAARTSQKTSATRASRRATASAA